ncbi:Lamin Tail Domain protein [uncultured archaeon]|nr:Lamin Tail Domain protein [uncultured archaeon]
MKILMLLLMLLPLVSASVVINQVLYDPVATESGGEAVELKNTGSSAVDISDWIIASESSATDATVPDGTILQAGATYLIADEGWGDSKDDKSWRSADHEEKITLGNSDSGIALLSNGTIMDAVGWGDVEGIEESLYEGSPAALVASGKSLLRTQDTNDNSKDFIESVADFQEGIPVPVTADVIISAPVIEISKSLNLAPEGVLSIRNNGAVKVNIKLLFNDFVYKNFTISKTAISLDGPSEFVVEPNAEHKSKVSLRIPANAVPGKYASTLRVIITSGS